MKRQITHTGTVASVENGHVVVHIGRRSACSSCAASATCGTAEQKGLVVDARLATGTTAVHKGDIVVVSETRGKALMSVLAGYGLPLLLMVVACFTAISCGVSEEMAALTALAILPIYYVGLWLMRDRLAQMFAPVVTTLAGGAACSDACQTTPFGSGLCDTLDENCDK